uniref:Uncharacterized protein n=1 Tax=Sinocyclocheilus grahami TaxID=75366 RepID=A0A672P6U4_SINGR
MRISVTFEGSCRPLHISPHQTVGSIKKMIMVFELLSVQRYLELSYAGAALQDNWCVSDFGIDVSKAILHVFSAITKATLPIMEPVTLLRFLVSKLKSVVSLQLGIPVSSFRLSTGSGLHLYYCNLLSDYAVQAGKSHLQSHLITETHTDKISR